MKIFVSGCGSIGKRHIGNIRKILSCRIFAFDPDIEKRKNVGDQFGIPVFEKFEDVLNENPDVAIIASPTSFHLEQAKLSALKGCHIFVEKPISHSMDGVYEFTEIVRSRNLIVLIGYNMRFHPCLKKIKQILTKDEIGKIISARIQYGHYLPDWHPLEDYRKGYSAKNELGGGIILDASHEIDYIRWFLGDIKNVFAFSGKLSSLEIDTEDIAEILVKFDSGTIGEIHLDYIQRTRSRDCQIIAENGTIIWNFSDGCVKLFSIKKKEWEIFPLKKDFDFNETYIDEMKYFIDCVEKNKKAYPDEEDGKKVLEIALAVKQSSSSKKLVELC